MTCPDRSTHQVITVTETDRLLERAARAGRARAEGRTAPTPRTGGRRMTVSCSCGWSLAVRAARVQATVEHHAAACELSPAECHGYIHRDDCEGDCQGGAL